MGQKPTYAELLQRIKDLEERQATYRTSELKFQNFINASPMGIHLYELKEDDRLVFIGANSASNRILGVDYEQFMGKTIEEAFPALAETEVPQRYREAARNGIQWHTEQIEYHEGAITGAFEVVAFQTEPQKMAALFNEITTRKQTEDALRKSEERFRTLVEESPLGISLIDKRGRYRYINPAFRKMFGYTLEDIPTGSEWFRKAYPDKSYRRRVVASWVEGKREFDHELTRRWIYTVLCKDGSSKEIHFRPVTLENNDQFVIYEDITEKTKLEHQFQQAQKFEAIGTLAGGVAHDFNNLLMGIQGRASLMEAELAHSHAHLEHLKAIEEHVRSASDLTKQLLGFARGGKYEVMPVDLNEIVISSADMFGRTKKEILIHIKTQSDPLVVEVDRRQIEQILLNLYVNAWQAMPEGGDLFLETNALVLDEVYCAPHQVRPGTYIKVSITDTGIGMDKDTRQRIFDPFFTTKEKGRGTGLGLASAYGIVKNHDGMITVYSEVGQGTTFNIYLPTSEHAVKHEAPGEVGLIEGSESILLVDDEDIITDVGCAMLEKLGYRVRVAKGGEQALETITAKGDDIDLVILDLVMPGLDGRKTFDRLRALYPAMPVILSSGYALTDMATEILQKGCNGFIQKPFNMSELSQKVRSVLDKDKNRVEPRGEI